MGVVANTVFADGLVLKANSSDSITGSNPIGLNDVLADALSLSGIAVGGSGSAGAQTVSGPLTLSGALTLSSAVNAHVTVVNSAGPYAVAATDAFIAVTYSGGAMTITLPTSPATGRAISIKDGAGAAATNNITITATQTIDGVAGGTGIVIVQNYGAVNLVYTGSVWLLFDYGVTPNALSLTQGSLQTISGPITFSSAPIFSVAPTFSTGVTLANGLTVNTTAPTFNTAITFPDVITFSSAPVFSTGVTLANGLTVNTTAPTFNTAITFPDVITFTSAPVFSTAVSFSNPVTISSAIYGHVTTVSTAGPYAVATGDRYIIVTYTGAAMTITLPTSPTTGRLLDITDGVGGAGTRNITITASQTIDGITGSTGIIIAQNYGSVSLLYTGSVWLLL